MTDNECPKCGGILRTVCYRCIAIKGGKAGRWDSKRRGTSAYYASLRKGKGKKEEGGE